jgi:hypothetical protein
MLRLLTLPCAIGVIAILVAPVWSAVVVNGSFESPPVPVGGYTNFAAGSSAITGWDVVGTDHVTIVHTTHYDGVVTYQAQDGDQWIDLTGAGSNLPSNGIMQTIATTTGTSYVLTFYVGSTSYLSTVDLSIDGSPRISFTNPIGGSNSINWQQFTYPFLALNSTTSITFYNGSTPIVNHLSALDNVSIAAAVPVPPSFLCFALISVLGYAFRATLMRLGG